MYTIKQFGKSPYAKDPVIPHVTRGGNTTFVEHPKEEPLTGVVQGLKAAQGEERFARTIDNGIKQGIVRYHKFRSSPGIPKGMPGWKELDELVYLNKGAIAISIKGADFVHKTGASKQQDAINEMFQLARLKANNVDVLGNKIETVLASDLVTQEQADKQGKKLGIIR